MAAPSEKQSAAHSHEETVNTNGSGGRIQTLAEEAQADAVHINLSWR
jgi:hypothetical protein